jgi:hypothetical protein
MATTTESNTPKVPSASRRAKKSTPKPVIDVSVKPTPEQFTANIDAYKGVYRLRNEKSGPIVERLVAKEAMALRTGVTQPTDAAGNVVRTTAIVEKDDEKVIESIVELLATFPEARTSWVTALRTARWTRKAEPKPIMRADGSFYLSCTTDRWGKNSAHGLYHIALDRFNAAQAKAAKPTKAPAKKTTPRARKTA